jgi:hypothetical protein
MDAPNCAPAVMVEGRTWPTGRKFALAVARFHTIELPAFSLPCTYLFWMPAAIRLPLTETLVPSWSLAPPASSTSFCVFA